MPWRLCGKCLGCSMPGRACRCVLQDKFRWKNPSNGSEEEKPLPARRHLLVWNVGKVRKVATLKRGHGLLNEQRARFFLAKLLPHDVVSGLKTQRPAPGIVRIAGHEVHDPSRDPAQRILFSARAKTSGQGACGHLNKATQPGPLGEAMRPAAEKGVAARGTDQ